MTRIHARKTLGHRFSKGTRVYHRHRLDNPGRVTKQHFNSSGQPIAQYSVEWERAPGGFGTKRTTVEWESDLRFAPEGV